MPWIGPSKAILIYFLILNLQIRTGKVNIAIQGANIPGVDTDFDIPGSRRTSRGSRRGFFGGVKSIFGDVTSAVVGEVTGAHIIF
jgi:hypothetical protein